MGLGILMFKDPKDGRNGDYDQIGRNAEKKREGGVSKNRRKDDRNLQNNFIGQDIE